MEQVKVVRTSDTDGFVRKLGFMPDDVSLELVVERLADGSQRWQGEQLTVGDRRISRARRQEDAAQAKSAAIEFAQSQGIGNRRPTLQQRRAHRQSAAK